MAGWRLPPSGGICNCASAHPSAELTPEKGIFVFSGWNRKEGELSVNGGGQGIILDFSRSLGHPTRDMAGHSRCSVRLRMEMNVGK